MKKYNIYLRLMRPVIHAFLIMCVFYFMYKLRLRTDLIPWIQLRIPVINYEETMIYALISAFMFVWIGIIKNLYELNKPIQNYFQTFTKVWIYWLISITFLAYFGWWLIFIGWISRFIIVIWSCFSFFVLFFFDQVWNLLESKSHSSSINKILIIGSSTLDSYDAIDKIKNWFSFKTEYVNVADMNWVSVEDYFIVIAVWSFSKKVLQEIFEKVRYSKYTRFYHISEWFFLEDVVYQPENIDNIIALEYKHSKLDGRSQVFKRLFDLFGSIILIIVLSPVMLIVAILIKIESKWPVIYKSKRIGKYWKLFTFLKFRSMYTHLSVGEGYGWKNADKIYQDLIESDQNVRHWLLAKIKDDPRVTKVWKFIRKTSLDELPQLFCSLWWTMSLIWPRPHLEEEVANYESRQKRLLSINPGITWYAQVFGRNNLDFQEEAKLDLYYIQNWNLFLDFYILFATFGVVFKGM